MERDLDKKLYNDYLNGKKQAFEYIYKKYKNRIEYFIYNIVKNYQKAEDLTQETFIYVMQNKMRENKSSIRVYSKFTDSNGEETIYIKDVEYLNGIYYFNNYNLKDSEESYFNSFTKLQKRNSSYGIVYY